MDFTALSPQQVLDLSKPCAEYARLLETYKPPQVDYSNPFIALALLRHQSITGLRADQADPEVREQVYEVKVRDGAVLSVKAFRPSLSSREGTSRPLIVLYFSGGFVMGHPLTLAHLARTLVKRYNAVVVTPGYRLAPEFPFPVGQNDGCDTLAWIAAKATTILRADPSKGFVIGGIASGGEIANVVAHLARDCGLKPAITGVWLSCAGPRLAPSHAEKLPKVYRERLLSHEQDGNVALPELAEMSRTYLNADEESKLFSPLIWPTHEGHKGLPRTYVQVCGIDSHRDEALIFHDMLKKEGVSTRLDMYAGLPHAFFHTHKDLPQSKQWEQDTIDGFAWLLEPEASEQAE